MADWDEDSPRLHANPTRVLAAIAAAAPGRARPAVEAARQWQRATMAGLDVPHPDYVGRFRGEPGLEGIEVVLGDAHGVPATGVAAELAQFEQTLASIVERLDAMYPGADDLDGDGLEAVIELAPGRTPSGSASIPSPTATAAPPACGPTPSSCATASSR
jgi:hypothetical protein